MFEESRMRALRSLVLILGLGTSTATALTAQGSPLQTAVAQAGGRVIITLRRSPNAPPSIMAPGSPPVPVVELTQISERLQGTFTFSEAARADRFGMVIGEVDPARVDALAADSNVAAVEPDRLWAVADVGGNGDRWAAYHRPAMRADDIPTGVSQVTAPDAWALGYRGDGIKVAVLDSGGDPTHPDLNYAGGYDAVHQNTTNWTDDISVCNGHGTHIAGTIAAKDDGQGIVGVAPHVQLYAIKVFENVGGSCLAYTSSQIYGLNWAVSQGIRLVNVSIGGSYSGSYEAAITTAANAGTYVFAAAGNNGGAVTYPGSAAYAFGIAAVDASNVRASWSDFGPEVDFSAPGVGITSTMPGGGYGSKSGTSMATPHALGVAALILSSNPSLSWSDLRQKMIDGALDLETSGYDYDTGYGLLRAANSISGGGSSPLVLALSPGHRSTTVQQGGSAAGDNASVTLSGTGASSATWSATKRHSWTTLTNASGTGSGTVSWSRSASGLAVGTYVDTITVTASGATGSPSAVIDTLVVTAPPPPLVLALSPSHRSTSVQQGGSAAGDNASVTLSGTGAASTTWSATKRHSWTTLTTASGTGSGTVSWNRNASGLAVGTYVDTITVTASGATGSPSTVIDTLTVTAAPPPLVLAVSPSSRSTSVQQGGSAAGDNASVTLSGTGAASATWSATKRHSWTTLTTASGTGSGTVSWNRNASGLAVGTYVDTITVTASGATGSPSTVIDTLTVTAAPPPLVLAVSPSSRSTSVQQGGSAAGDNASVTLSGTGASSATWSATKRHSWTTLTNASGTGSGTVSWNRNASGLAVGTYVDTITVTASGATGSPSTVIDTLIVTSAPSAVVLAVSPSSRIAIIQQGDPAPSTSGTVTLSGTGSAAATWSATKRHAWTTLTTASGTGSGTVGWSRSTAGLAPGNYVDTITVTSPGAIGSPAMIIDTLAIYAIPVPLRIAVSPTSITTSVVAGSAAPDGHATVSMTGDNSTTATWSVLKRQPWTTLTSLVGVGSGTIGWTRNTAGLAPGVYVDTVSVLASGAAGSPAMVIDSLVITAAASPVTLAVSPSTRHVTIQQGSSAPGDDAAVTLSGTGAGTTDWSATKRHAWTTLTSGSGTGSGTVAWTRNAAGLAVGTYVDTITVTASGATGSPSMVIDSLVVAAAPPPLVLAVSPASRHATAQQGGAAPGDNATVTLSGSGASSATWSTTRRHAWTTLTTASGTGSGTVSWSRSASGLAVGTYVDTISITAAGAIGSPGVIIDTLTVTAAPVGLALAVSPSSRSATAQQGASAPGDNAAVTLSGTGASSATWNATRRHSWTTLTTASGTGSGTVAWNRNTAGLAVGTYVDTITVTASGAAGSPGTIIDTLRITVVPVPLGVVVSPHSRHVSVAQGSTAPTDNADITITGDGSLSASWSATSRKSWTHLMTSAGTGSGTVTWSRTADGLAAGTYVDTIAVAVAGVADQTTVIDTMVVTAARSVATSPRGRRFRILTQFGSARLLEPIVDSAQVSGTVLEGQADTWQATAGASWLHLTVNGGHLGEWMRWQRVPDGLGAGLHVDTVHVALTASPDVQAILVDTLEVVAVAAPTAQAAVEDLFHVGAMTADQRALLDRDGNNNGSYDLGDFLAWVDQQHISLSAAMTARLEGLLRSDPAAAAELLRPRKPVSGGSIPR